MRLAEDTLALHGLEEPAHASRGLEEPFFQLCGCFSFLFWRELLRPEKKVLVVSLAGAPCQDMKPGPQGKLMYYYFYHGSDLRKIFQFLREIECIEFECKEFVLVLVQIDLIHFEHSICISST
jgi:hypothetical protein